MALQRLLIRVALTAGLSAGVALSSTALAFASESPPASSAEASQTTTSATPGQGTPETTTAPAEAPAETVTTTQATTSPSPAPEAVRQRSQPASGESASPPNKTTPKSAGPTQPPSGSWGHSKTSGAALAHSLALAPGTLTPALPPSLSGTIGGIPSFFINSFSIPPFLLPIYQAAGAAYGIPWQVLAAINEVETDYGRDLNLSSAGAEGWMQFLPVEWAQFGVDVNNDGFEDPYNPADAIFAAARYLKQAGGTHDIRSAVFAYNHSKAYVNSVMLRARLLGGTPPELLGAVTGLSEARFPVYAPSHYDDGFSTTSTGKTLVGTAIYSQPGAPVVAVQDARVASIGESAELGRYVSLVDAYGNSYTYGQLGQLATLYPVLEGRKRFSLHPLHAGVQVIAGTVLGHLATDGGSAAEPHMLFQIKPAGPNAPLIDPKPVLDGWVKLQSSSAIRATNGQSGVAKMALPTPGQALLESKARLERQIARERDIVLPACERRLIADGRVDRRVLAVLQFTASSGLAPTVREGSCRSGHAVGISAISRASVVGSGGEASSIAISTVRRLLTLQGTMRPRTISGPAGLPKATNVVVVPGHPDRIRISYGLHGAHGAHTASFLGGGLSPAQWVKLIARLGQIPDPNVTAKPSPAAIPDQAVTGASNGGRG
jgi:Transglycosylase SLT domain